MDAGTLKLYFPILNAELTMKGRRVNDAPLPLTLER